MELQRNASVRYLLRVPCTAPHVSRILGGKFTNVGNKVLHICNKRTSRPKGWVYIKHRRTHFNARVLKLCEISHSCFFFKISK